MDKRLLKDTRKKKNISLMELREKTGINIDILLKIDNCVLRPLEKEVEAINKCLGTDFLVTDFEIKNEKNNIKIEDLKCCGNCWYMRQKNFCIHHKKKVNSGYCCGTWTFDRIIHDDRNKLKEGGVITNDI